MLNCPQCGADYSEQGLDNGRCRACGKIVQWGATAVPTQSLAWSFPPAQPPPAATGMPSTSSFASDDQPSNDQPSNATPPPAQTPAPPPASSANPSFSSESDPPHSDERTDGDGPADPLQATIQFSEGRENLDAGSPPDDRQDGTSEKETSDDDSDTESETADQLLETVHLTPEDRSRLASAPPGDENRTLVDESRTIVDEQHTVVEEQRPADDQRRTIADEQLTLRDDNRTVQTGDDAREVKGSEVTVGNDLVTVQWEDAAGKTDRQTATIMTESTELRAERRLRIPRRGVRSADGDEATVADYELIQVIGRGGEGVVHAARQTSIDRTVALKMSHRPTVSDVHSKNKFLSEAVITGALEHPNIVPVYELGTTNDGTAFYSMKRIEGTPWSKVIAKKSQAENLSILMRTADAVAMAHARGVVHRDLKPENVMLGEFGEVMLTDWGIALCTPWFAKRTSIVVAQGLGGTPAYMAPEMATGPVDTIGPAADIYLLGAILYQIVTGKPPHHSTSALKCLQVASRNEIQPTDVRSELVDIALKAMKTKPSDRYQSVKDFQDAIRDYQSHTESVVLADQARHDLKQAAESGDYKDYAAAMVGFQKAVELWPGNHEAAGEMVESAAAYAAHALKKGDLDLALSLLDPQVADHQALRQRVVGARIERDARHRRLRRLRYTALSLLLAIFIGGTYAFLRVAAARRTAETMQQRATVAADEAKQQAALAEQQRQAAVRSSELAASREMEARAARAEAEAAAVRATEARMLSDEARMEADAALRRAEVASYGSAISLAAGNIANNAFSDALAVLREQAARSQTAPLRGWEWGRLMYLSLGGDPESPGGRAVRDLPVESEATGLSVAREAGVLAVSTMQGDVYVWSRQRTGDAPADTSVSLDQLDSQSLHRTTVPSKENQVRLVSLGNQNGDQSSSDWSVRIIAPADDIFFNDVALSANGRRLATAGSDGSIRIYSIQRPDKPPQILTGHRGQVHTLEFAPQGDTELLASAGDDRTIRLWNTTNGKNVRTLVGHASQIWSVAFSPAGDRLVSSSQDFTVRIWSVASGAELQRFRQHQEPVFTAVFSPDGNFVASGGYDKRILVWPANRNQPVYPTLVDDVTERLESDLPPEQTAVDPEVTVLSGHTGGIREVSFSSDGRFILSASRDNTLRVWPWGSDANGPTESGGRKPASESLASDQSMASEKERGRLPVGASSIKVLPLRGHGGWVTSGRFWDDETVVSAAYDGKVKIWDLPSYRPTIELHGLDRPVLAGRFTPDGRSVLVALDDGTAGIWDRQTGRRKASLDEGHDFLAMKAAFVPDATRMVTVAGDDTVRCWNVNSGGEIWKRNGAGRRGLLSLSPDGGSLVTGSSDGKAARIISVESGEVKGILSPKSIGATLVPNATSKATDDAEVRQDNLADVTAVAYSPDGLSIATADQVGLVRVFDAASGSLRQTLNGHDGAVSVLQWMPDSRTLLTASVDTSIAFWNVDEGQEIAGKRLLHDDAVSLFEVAGDGQQAVSVAADRLGNQSLYHWNLADRRLIKRYPPIQKSSNDSAETQSSNTISSFVINSVMFPSTDSGGIPDNVLVATFNPASARYGVQRWDLNTGDLFPLREQTQRSGMIFSALAAQVATADRSGPLPEMLERILTVGGSGARIWDESAGRELMNYRPHGAVLDIDMSNDGKRIATVGSDQSIKIWGRSGAGQPWRVVQKLLGRHRGKIRTVQFAVAEETTSLFSAGEDRTITCWKTDDRGRWRVANVLEGHTDAVMDLAVSPDGRYLASASADKTIRVWRLDRGECTSVLRGHQAGVLAVAFFNDSHRLVSGGEDRRGMVWDLKTGERITVLAGHSAAVNSVHPSPDGRRVITGSQDNLVKLWNLSPDVLADGDSAKELLSLSDHNREVMAVRFSPDGRTLFSAGLDGQAFLRPSIAVESR